jgi:hypothetical protein
MRYYMQEGKESYQLVSSLGRRLRLGDINPDTLESWKNLIDLYEAWPNRNSSSVFTRRAGLNKLLAEYKQG